jgi:hypothetical protein
MYIPMDPSSTPQAPSGPMTRARARALESEVTSLLCEFPCDTLGTWILPQEETLCVLRYQEEGRKQEERQEQGEGIATAQELRYNRSTTGQPPLNRYNRSTTAQPSLRLGQVSVLKRFKAGTTPVVPLNASIPVQPVLVPVQPPRLCETD